MITSIILFFIIISLLVLVHEFGHFIVAKRAGIRVDEFGLGFPPRLYGRKFGETLYTINALPFGGFVKIFGEDPNDESICGPDKARSFVHKPRVVQAAVIAAGVTMNALLAWVLLSIGFMIGMPLPASEYPHATVSDPRLIITNVAPETPAERAGLVPGDEIILFESGGESLRDITPQGVQSFVIATDKRPITVVYKHAAEEQKTVVTPVDGIVPGRPAIGIEMDTIGLVRLGPLEAIVEGGKLTWGLTKLVAGAFVGLIADSFRGQADVASLSGPVGIVGIVGEQASMGFIYLLTLVAMISVNLAVLNLVPVPGLDGGRLLFVLLESLARRRISPKVANTANAIGFGLLILLLVFITYNDIAKLL